MAQPTIEFNLSNSSLGIYEMHSGVQIGSLYPGEHYTYMGFTEKSRYTGRQERVVMCMTPTKGWTRCRINANSSMFSRNAYVNDYRMSTRNGDPVFSCRRAAKVFADTNHINTIYAGDAIQTDGNSYGGLTYPNRLYIKAYRKNGAWSIAPDLWVETGINIPAYNGSPSIYGKW